MTNPNARPQKSNEVPERKQRYHVDDSQSHYAKRKKRRLLVAEHGKGWSTGKVMRIVPDADVNLLIQIGENNTQYHWYIGDIANKWAQMGMPHMWVYKTVAELTGKSTSSVRNYAYVARRFNRDIREQFSTLRFDHYMFALKCDAPMDVIEYASGVSDERDGRPASVDELKAVFRGQRRLDIEDEKMVFGAKAYWPAYSIGIRRKLMQIDDMARREQAEKLLLALCNILEGQSLTSRE